MTVTSLVLMPPWLLAEVAGEKTVNHGGTTFGQHSAFSMMPSKRYAFTSLTNCGPNGPKLNEAIGKWALEHFLGLVAKEVVGIRLSDAELAPYTGTFETIAATVTISASDGRLSAQVTPKPEIAARMRAGGEEEEPQPPIVLAIQEGNPDRYVVDEGDAKGMKGYFSRQADGSIDAVHLGGRLATRVS